MYDKSDRMREMFTNTITEVFQDVDERFAVEFDSVDRRYVVGHGSLRSEGWEAVDVIV